MDAQLDGRIEAVRAFNRFYTPRIGLLREGYLDSRYGLTEVRVLFELARGGPATAADIARRLSLDPGYLSRLLRSFIEAGMVDRTRSAADGRQAIVTLTGEGRAVFDGLDSRARDDVAAMLSGLPAGDQRRLIAALAAVEQILGDRERPAVPYVLRPPRSGDLGWVVQRHGEVYAQEYGWDERFEALVAEIVGGFGREHDPRRERCWIAEVAGENAGSIFCIRKDDEVAQLRLLFVEPSARGLGIGSRLVDECVRFARAAGYRKVTLWTNDVLVAARRIYEAAGFALVEEERHAMFGHDLVSQVWDLDFDAAST